MGVNNRHIIYVQGYDPRGLAQYYRMFRTELRKFSALYGLDSKISRPSVSEDGEKASWSIDTKGPDWSTRTTYDFLRWEDLIKQDLAWPIWRTVIQATLIYWRLLFAGTLTRFWKAHWRFAVFISYPHLMLLLQAIITGAISACIGYGLAWLGTPALLAGTGCAILFAGLLHLSLKHTERHTYVLYLMADTIFTWEFSHRDRPDWDARIDRFAQHLVETTRASPADEIILVGHSSGSFLCVEILARALAIDPELGHHGPKVVLLTLGGNMPIVGFHDISAPFRAHLQTLATHPSIDWIDCQSRKDVMNFYPFEPVSGHGIDAGPDQRNPVIVPIRFRELVSPAIYNRFRWQFFRVHFQFVMANDQPNNYDFYMIVCGRLQLRDRFSGHAVAQEPQSAPIE